MASVINSLPLKLSEALSTMKASYNMLDTIIKEPTSVEVRGVLLCIKQLLILQISEIENEN